MDRLIKKISDSLWKYANVPNADKDIIEFGLYYVILYASTISILLVSAILLHVLPQAIAAAAAACILRNFSGGAHFESPEICIILSGLAYPFFAVLAGFWPDRPALPTLLIVNTLGFAALVRYSPSESPAKPLSPYKKQSLRLWSLIIMGFWICTSPFITETSTLIAVTFSIGWQCFSITPACNRLYAGVDTITGLILRKRCVS